MQTYLQQEIQMEAAARNLVSFTRFLEVAALANGKVTNVSKPAKPEALDHTRQQFTGLLAGIRRCKICKLTANKAGSFRYSV